jgi:hypothetical protein
VRLIYLDHIAATPARPEVEVFPPIVDKLRRMSPLYTKFLEEKMS